jgi:hypothetical protein
MTSQGRVILSEEKEGEPTNKSNKEEYISIFIGMGSWLPGKGYRLWVIGNGECNRDARKLAPVESPAGCAGAQFNGVKKVVS